MSTKVSAKDRARIKTANKAARLALEAVYVLLLSADGQLGEGPSPSRVRGKLRHFFMLAGTPGTGDGPTVQELVEKADGAWGVFTTAADEPVQWCGIRADSATRWAIELFREVARTLQAWREANEEREREAKIIVDARGWNALDDHNEERLIDLWPSKQNELRSQFDLPGQATVERAIELECDRAIHPGIARRLDNADSGGLAAAPRTEPAKAALKIIQARKGCGLFAKEIVRKLGEKGIIIAESTFRRHTYPEELKHVGVKNSRSRGGYYWPE